jgi:WD40 repeat protein
MSFLQPGMILVAVVAFGLGEPAKGDSPEKDSKSNQAKSQPARTDLYGDPLPAGAIGRLGTVRFRHSGPIRCLAFSPDGKTVLSGGFDCRVRLWEIATGKQIWQIGIDPPSFENVVEAVAFSPSGKTLAAAAGRVVFLWDVATRKELGRLEGHDEEIKRLVFSSDGKTLASASEDKTVRLWDVQAAKEIRKLIGHEQIVGSVAFSPDGKFVASGSLDLTVRVWESKTGMESHRFRLGSLEAKDSGNVPAVAFSPDGKLLAAAATYYKESIKKWQRKVILWDSKSGKELRSFLSQSKWIASVHFIRQGKVLAAEADGILHFMEVDTGKELKAFPIEGNHIVFSPTEEYVATASDNAVRIWKASSGQDIHAVGGHVGGIELLAISPNGKNLISASNDHTARVWDMETGKQLRCHGDTEQNGIRVRAIAPDCKLLAWDHFGGEVIHLLETASLETASGKETGRISKVKEEGRTIYGIFAAFSPDSRTFAEKEIISDEKSGSQLDRVRLWDVATGKEIKRFYEGTGVHSYVHFSPDGKILAVANRRWEVATGKELPRYSGNDHSAIQAFSPDGRFVVFWEMEILSDRLLRASSGKALFTFPSRVGQFAFSPDGKTVAAKSYEDGQIILWELASGRERARFADLAPSHLGPQVFTPDGMTLAMGNDDTTILLWDVTGLRSGSQLPKLQLSPKEVDALWAKLADGDAAKAYQAIWKLAAAPQQATPFLKEYLKPIAPADPARIQILIVKLNDEKFAEREKATKELEGLAELAGPALRTVLAEKPSLEVQRRAEGLLPPNVCGSCAPLKCWSTSARRRLRKF